MAVTKKMKSEVKVKSINKHRKRRTRFVKERIPDIMVSMVFPDCLFLEIDSILVVLPSTGIKYRLPAAAFTGFHPVQYLPDRREVHTRHYGLAARANLPPAYGIINCNQSDDSLNFHNKKHFKETKKCKKILFN